MSKILMAAATLGFISLVGMSTAMASPIVECTLSEDKSQLIVLASNSGGTSFACLADCRFKLTGARANYSKQCTFSLSANRDEYSVCEVSGDGPDHFAEIMPTRFTCAPR